MRLHDPAGEPLGYAGRTLDPQYAHEHGKWKLPARLPKRSLLFNHHRVLPRLADGLALFEDVWSVMRLAQVNVPAVALLGTTLSPEQREMLRPSTRILLMLDGDSAGQTATDDLCRRLAWTQTSSVTRSWPPHTASSAK